MNLLVTGGAGFIGSAFVRRAVDESLHPVVVDKVTYAGDLQRIGEVRRHIRFYQADITDAALLEKVFVQEKPEIVLHFAAETHVDRSILAPRDFVNANVMGTANLLDVSLKYGVKRFIHLSTDEVYGELPQDKGVVFTETDPLLPNSPYSSSKAAADLLVRAYSKTYGLPTVIVRPSNNFGPWQYPEKLIPLAIARILLGEKIPVYGKGQNIRTWLFVEDCVEGILRIIEKGTTGEIYNIGSSEERKNIEVIRGLLEMLGKDEGLIEFVADRPGHDFRYAVDTAKMRRQTGWEPSHGFEEGLQKTVKWYLDNKGWLFRKKREVEVFVNSLRARYAEMRREE